MKRLYVVPKEVWEGPAIGLDGKPIVHTVQMPSGPQEVFLKMIDLFHPAAGSHYIDLDDTHILLSADVDHSESCAELWHSHPEVARLPHPVYEGKVTLHDAATSPDHEPKQFKAHHLDKLKAHKALRVDHTDTVLTLSKKAKAIHPLVKISAIL